MVKSQRAIFVQSIGLITYHMLAAVMIAVIERQWSIFTRTSLFFDHNEKEQQIVVDDLRDSFKILEKNEWDELESISIEVKPVRRKKDVRAIRKDKAVILNILHTGDHDKDLVSALTLALPHKLLLASR